MASVVVVGAIIGAVVGGISSAFGIDKGNKQLMKIYKEKMKYAQMNYNYNINQLDRAEKASYDAAISEIFNISSSAMQNESTMEVALSEAGYEGKTADQSKRSLSALSLNQITNTKAAEEADIASIYAKKDQLYMGFKNTLEQERQMTNDSFTTGFQAVTQIGQGAAMGAAIGAATAGAASAAGGAASTATTTATTASTTAPATTATTASTTASTASTATLHGGATSGVLGSLQKAPTPPPTTVNTPPKTPLSETEGFGGWWARYQNIYNTQAKPYVEAFEALNKGFDSINQNYYRNRYRGSY